MDGKVAIVGMSCRLPGGAHTPELFWHLLKNKICTMEDIPHSRFNLDDYWSKDGEVNKMLARKGHFLQDGTLFDEAFFNMSPREALNTDPQHRVLLECVVDALDNAGYRPSENGGEAGWNKSRFGVFVGSATDSYQNNLAANIDAYYCPGTIRGFAGGRVSYHFGFQGPCLVYDTACSSGLVAVHAACQSLLLKECDAAIASGSNMLTSPEMFIGLSKGFFISNTGGCRTFDETADGYCRAEGVGVLVLKRLEDAIRDNDKIEAVIAASGTNQSGGAESLTMPHAPTQSKLFASNCERAGISPLAVRAVEAHGTGTQAGDFVEMEAIKLAFCDARPPIADPQDESTTLYVSSLKPNVGHAESSSGIASVIKAALMLKHKTVLPHIGISTRLNPRLGDIGSKGIVIPTRPKLLLPAPGCSQVYISVNNFGAHGGNANVILHDSEHSNVLKEETIESRTYHVIGISAKPHTPFPTVVNRMLEYLENNSSEVNLADLGYTTTARRIDYPARLALSVSTVDELKQQLRKASTGVTVNGASTPRIGFLIAGNGSQFTGMGKGLYSTSPVFQGYINKCNEILQNRAGLSFMGIMEGDMDPFAVNYETFVSSSVCIFSVGYSLGMMWKEWGIAPSAILGHSLGEFSGLVLAGCLSVENAISILVRRAQLIFTGENISVEGGMLILGANEVDAERILEESNCTGVNLSCYNGPSQTCISGPREELLKLQDFVKGLPQPLLVKLLGSKFPWHSPLLAKAADKLKNDADLFDFTPAHTPIILNTEGSVLQPGDKPNATYIADQMHLPVRFDKCAGSSTAQSVDIWIELSAKSLLLPLLRSLVPSGVMVLPSLGGMDTDCWSSITKTLARLYEANAPVNWAAYHRPYGPKLVNLPSYPFARNEHWVHYTDRLHVPVTPAGSAVRGNIASTPLGQLEIVEPWKQYTLSTNGRHLTPGELIWLALSTTRGTGILDFQMTTTSSAAYVSVLIEEQNRNVWRVVFLNREESRAGNGTFAQCYVESGYFTPDAGMRKVLQRNRVALLSNPTSSIIGKSMASRMIGSTTSSECSLDKLIISDDGEEAVGQIAWDAKRPVEDVHGYLSSVPLTPQQLQSLLQPASLTTSLMTGSVTSGDVYIERLDFTREFKLSTEYLSAHVFLDSSNNRETTAQTYVYASDGSIYARVSGFKKSETHTKQEVDIVPRDPVLRSETATKHTPALERIQTIQPMDTNPTRESVSSRSLNHVNVNAIPTPPNSALDEETSTARAVKAGSQISKRRTVVGPRAELDEMLTVDRIKSVLVRELGIPLHSIDEDSKLEDLGVDSIMSLLLRDKLSEAVGKKMKWFIWKKGLSVQDLCTHALQAAM